MAEFDSGITCDDETKGPPVFILDDGVTIENLIIGPNQIDGNILPTLYFWKKLTNASQVSTAAAVVP
jgi:hypothetical protein